VQRRKLLVPLAHRKRLRRLDEAACALGVFLNIHRYFAHPAAPARGAISQSQVPVLRPIAPQI
jgi:hypothetical protein